MKAVWFNLSLFLIAPTAFAAIKIPVSGFSESFSISSAPRMQQMMLLNTMCDKAKQKFVSEGAVACRNRGSVMVRIFPADCEQQGDQMVVRGTIACRE